MKKTDKPYAPDFLVEMHSSSSSAAADIYCETPEKMLSAQIGAVFRTVIATLHTDTTHIEVTEIHWGEPTTIAFTPHRPGFCSPISSSSPIEYGYDSKSAKSGNLGRILFMVPGKEICSQNQPGTVRAVTCSFDLQYAENIMGSLEQFSAAQLNNALDIRSSLISAILLRLMHEAINPGAFTEEIVESYGRAMLLECAHYLLSENSLGNVEGQLTAQHFALIEKYLAGLSGELPSVSKLAGICGFSERYFAKLFREQTHCSVAQYIKNFQITKAKSLLLETDLALKEIGYRLGFSTSANFSSAFRAATGITPGQYRKTAHN